MRQYYTFNAKVDDSKFRDITVIFNPEKDYDFNALHLELTQHFQFFQQTSALVFISCSTNKNAQESITKNLEKIFKSIPKVEENSLQESLFFVNYGIDYFGFSQKDKFLIKNFAEIVNQGLVHIFVKNGGLIESNGINHHFEFPSGKHSAKFLRTANVLVTKSEIDFIAINTLYKFSKVEFRNIYCDTLSINVIGYSINRYLQRFNKHESNIESFKSYDGIYDKNTNFYDKSIFLISASTSGGLISYIKLNHPEINSANICVLFYLPLDKDSNLALERVVCNLIFNGKFNYGINKYDQSKKGEKCKFCNTGSTPIKILGDSFNLEEPVINTVNITSKYITKNIKDFVQQFKKNKKIGTALKVSFGSNYDFKKKYNVYFDYQKIISNIDLKEYEKHKKKINAYINQFIPSSLKYIIHLNDEGSKLLAEFIHKKVVKNSKNFIPIINHSELPEHNIMEYEKGSILIVGSCITNGKNLLYLSRYFRNHEDMRLVYFIGINRISSVEKQKELKSNIKFGLYGAENSSFVEIETIFCDNSNFQNSWQNELEVWKKYREEINEPIEFIENRISLINSFGDQNKRGGDSNIFFTSFNNEELKIRKNSAFFNDNRYFENITQSDVYFTISCVLNNMRNDKADGLFQTSFVKNILDPFVFNRFNDGIIQASILRAAKYKEINYSTNISNSENILVLLKTFIEHKDEFQGEAIFEFLFALGIGKLRLYKNHYGILLGELEKESDERIVIFADLIKKIYKEIL